MKKVILLYVVLSFVACTKADEQPINNTPLSYISMKINGEIWVGEKNFTSQIVETDFKAGMTKEINGKIQQFTINLGNIGKAGDYSLGVNYPGEIVFYDDQSNASWTIKNSSTGGFNLSITKAKFGGEITTGSGTLLPVQKYNASATFYGNAIDKDGKIINITEGIIKNYLAD